MRDCGLAILRVDNEMMLIMKHTINCSACYYFHCCSEKDFKELFAMCCVHRKLLSWKCAEMVTRILKGELIRQKDVSL